MSLFVFAALLPIVGAAAPPAVGDPKGLARARRKAQAGLSIKFDQGYWMIPALSSRPVHRTRSFRGVMPK
jgi:hypothetical protein